jgi:hypothetical protein
VPVGVKTLSELDEIEFTIRLNAGFDQFFALPAEVRDVVREEFLRHGRRAVGEGKAGLSQFVSSGYRVVFEVDPEHRTLTIHEVFPVGS